MSLTPLQRALSYPYECPDFDFILSNGEVVELDTLDPLQLMNSSINGRCLSEIFPHWQPVAKVVACGSNRAPTQLLRKFGSDWPSPVLSIHAQLLNWDAVRSAHITSYGTIPAALRVSPGARLSICVQLLDQHSLERMHRTEALGINYEYQKIEGVVLRSTAGEQMLRDCYVYNGLHGHLLLNGPQAFAEIECQGRSFSQLSQPELLRTVQQHLNPNQNLEEWVTEAQASRARRLEINSLLKQLR